MKAKEKTNHLRAPLNIFSKIAQVGIQICSARHDRFPDALEGITQDQEPAWSDGLRPTQINRLKLTNAFTCAINLLPATEVK